LGVYRFLLSRQWVILTLLGLVLIPVMIKLGFWQLHRHQSRVAHNHLIAHSLAADPVPIGRLTGVGREPAEDDQYRTVTATGRYDTRHEVVVRQRTAADGQSIGYFVVTPLIRGDGTAVLVNRGWIAAGGDLTKFPEVPEPPRGQVQVRGRIMADETSAASGIEDRKGLPPHQVMLINSRQQAKALHRRVLHGNMQLTHTSPKPQGKQPASIPPPDHDSIGPHMAYAVQWWLFASAVPFGWGVLVRRERRDQLTARARESAPDGPGGPDGEPEDEPDADASSAGPTEDTGDAPGDEATPARPDPGEKCAADGKPDSGKSADGTSPSGTGEETGDCGPDPLRAGAHTGIPD
jgi:cytochrome oxidase assembly protein ShyY1